jgi:hypothetical protein
MYYRDFPTQPTLSIQMINTKLYMVWNILVRVTWYKINNLLRTEKESSVKATLVVASGKSNSRYSVYAN